MPNPLTGATSSSGVATLDSTLMQQTKAEIRTLAAEIAELAHSSISPSDFYAGFLPRLCVSMGATGAAVWEFKSGAQSQLVANHSLPAELFSGCQPSEPHARILACVAAEGKPILVPPRTVTVEADRPNNPLDKSLIFVPVRVEDNVDFALQVVQRPSGGPAAQRGYLRFVAQMADLLADYLRRQVLRELSAHRNRLERMETWLLRLASAPAATARAIVTAEALRDLLDAEQAIIITGCRHARVRAMSGVRSIDPRSEVALAAKALVKSAAKENQQTSAGDLAWYTASDRRHNANQSEADSQAAATASFQTEIDRLCDLLHCRRLLGLCLNDRDACTALIVYASSASPMGSDPTSWESQAKQLAISLGTLGTSNAAAHSWIARLPFASRTSKGVQSRFQFMRNLVAGLALCGLALAVALFPVPQQISATAILQPDCKSLYFAPHTGVVTEVFVKEGQTVGPQEPLVQLASRDLEHEMDQLEGELQLNLDRLEQLADLRNRGTDLTSRESDRLEGEIEQLRISQRIGGRRLEVLRERQKELVVVAHESGLVASWDIANRLRNKPVETGDVLLTTYDPEGSWNLQLAIPDNRAGLVANAIKVAQDRDPRGGAPVRFSLSSHPDQLFNGYLVKLSSHAVPKSPNNAITEPKTVMGQAIFDPKILPLRQDGAIARATIDCGQVPAIWLVVRDAYQAISSRVQMLW